MLSMTPFILQKEKRKRKGLLISFENTEENAELNVPAHSTRVSLVRVSAYFGLECITCQNSFGLVRNKFGSVVL